MKTISDIRHANLTALIAKAGSVQAFADSISRSHSQVSQLKNRSKHSGSGHPREIGDDFARHVEQKLGLPRGWMDTPQDASARPITASRAAPTPPPPDFSDRRVVSDSDWQLLQDFSQLPTSEQEGLRLKVREEATKYKAFAEEVLQRLLEKGT